MLFTIITLNGRSFTFDADEVEDYGERYVFSVGDDVVASFLIKGIAGYFATEVEDEESF